ncbi:hypothetical protein ERX46_00645 [Brumimicrobium glaciale]|uniref:Uncharacterized protein n=1 Tax=Brumimicrobium glaciale TaxID=200475 RepID=A0A4Q4KS99_9FLAO|nr:hypothetical protein [Brumimicrobium glaciale]RYM35529.1 hypothetical protein ERX46_00645 [Brumimicrobium glaciale]
MISFTPYTCHRNIIELAQYSKENLSLEEFLQTKMYPTGVYCSMYAGAHAWSQTNGFSRINLISIRKFKI